MGISVFDNPSLYRSRCSDLWLSRRRDARVVYLSLYYYIEHKIYYTPRAKWYTILKRYCAHNNYCGDDEKKNSSLFFRRCTGGPQNEDERGKNLIA